MAFPTFHKASDLLSADSVNAANIALTRAINNTAKSFSSGMFNVGQTLEDARVADIMSRVAGEQDRERYIQALNREDLGGLSSQALQQLAMTRPDQLLKNAQNEARIFTSLRQDQRNQFKFDEENNAKLASATLAANVLRNGPEGAGLALPGLIQQFGGSPAGLLTLITGATKGNIPYYLDMKEAPVSQDTATAIPWVNRDENGKYVLQRGGISNDAAIQQMLTGIAGFKNDHSGVFKYYDEAGNYTGPTFQQLADKLKDIADKEDKSGNRTQYQKIRDNFTTAVNAVKSHFKGQIPDDLAAAFVFDYYDSRNLFGRLIGNPTFGTKDAINALTPYANKRLSNLLTQRSQLLGYEKELKDAAQKIRQADATYAAAKRMYDARAAIDSDPSSVALNTWLTGRAAYNREQAYIPVMRAVQGVISNLYPEALVPKSKQIITTATKDKDKK